MTNRLLKYQLYPIFVVLLKNMKNKILSKTNAQKNLKFNMKTPIIKISINIDIPKIMKKWKEFPNVFLKTNTPLV